MKSSSNKKIKRWSLYIILLEHLIQSYKRESLII